MVAGDLYIGLMSGTSLDGVDAVLLQINEGKHQVLDASFTPFPPTLRQQLLDLHQIGRNELDRAAIAGNALARIYADTVHQLLGSAGTPPNDIRAIGCHGQTIRHRPENGYTLQIGNPSLLAELTGICTVSDFRSRDIAAGGQGAPLAPAFHQAVFASTEERRCIINIGGMANITQLHGEPIIGFDSGPGNVLLDSWIQLHKGLAFDKNGAWAASGKALPGMLKAMLSDNYFSLAPPKSTGREQFDQHWLETFLTGSEKPEDVQATLAELTARSICSSLPTDTQALYVCGGGAMNTYLMQRLEAISGKTTLTTEALGVSPQWLEAIAFAWLAKQCIEGRHGNIASVTGAIGERVLGAIYQA